MTTFQFIAVGTSLGGFHALETVLGGLPKDFPLPLGVVQHRSFEDSEVLTSLLAGCTQLPVIEVEDKQKIEDGRVYVCPSNYHLLVDGDHFALSTDAPVLSARPAIDMFFESAAENFRGDLIGVLLTGMSNDGTAGLQKIKEYGGFVIVQDPVAAEGPLMPEAAISAVAVDKILPLQQIGHFLVQMCTRANEVQA